MELTLICVLLHNYVTRDDAASMIMRKGRGSQLAKVDLESAYRMVLVHPEDRQLLGMEWQGKWYVDAALPFSLRSALKVFTALTDGLMWTMYNHGVQAAIHYLDDYLMVGDPHTQESAQAQHDTLFLCEQLGVPMSKTKVEGPATVLVFLGILLDTIKPELHLSEEKLAWLKQMIREWNRRKSCTNCNCYH